MCSFTRQIAHRNMMILMINYIVHTTSNSFVSDSVTGYAHWVGNVLTVLLPKLSKNDIVLYVLVCL